MPVCYMPEIAEKTTDNSYCKLLLNYLNSDHLKYSLYVCACLVVLMLAAGALFFN